MGIRETQIYGLNEWSQKYITEHAVKKPHVVCPDCGKVITLIEDSVMWKDASNVGMFDDGPQLHQYLMDDGAIVREEIQSAMWSSGPCIFLKLQKANKSTNEWEDILESVWEDEVVDNA